LSKAKAKSEKVKKPASRVTVTEGTGTGKGTGKKEEKVKEVNLICPDCLTRTIVAGLDTCQTCHNARLAGAKAAVTTKQAPTSRERELLKELAKFQKELKELREREAGAKATQAQAPAGAGTDPAPVVSAGDTQPPVQPTDQPTAPADPVPVQEEPNDLWGQDGKVARTLKEVS